LPSFDQPLERKTLDIKMRYLSTAPPSSEIVHVDITDESLELMGRWPWPRSKLAGVLEILDEAGADIIALDIEMPEPQAVRFISDKTDPYFPPREIIAADGATDVTAVFDDSMLAEVMAKSGKCLMPMHIDTGSPRNLSDRNRQLEKLFSELVTVDIILSFDESRSKIPSELIEDCRNSDPYSIPRAYLRQRALIALERFALEDDKLSNLHIRTGAIIPPLATLIQTASQSGFVTVDPDSDGVVRRIPMIMKAGGRCYPQFALAIAIKSLQREHGHCTIQADADGIELKFADGLERDIPVDDQGSMLINWILPKTQEASGPLHISVKQVADIWQDR